MLTIAHESTLPNPRRGWATLTSFAVQTTGLALILAIPLLQPGLLPRLDLTPHPVPLFLPRIVMPSVQQVSSGNPVAGSHPSIFVSPWKIPRHTDRGPDTTVPREADSSCNGCIPETGQPSTVPVGIGIGIAIVPLPLSKPVQKPLRISTMMDGMLIHRVQPDYPFAAKQTHVQGVVEIAALISKGGTIENLRAVSGHPMLIRAALDAVKQWRYRPYVLNGDPIEVETQITVTFSLAGN